VGATAELTAPTAVGSGDLLGHGGCIFNKLTNLVYRISGTPTMKHGVTVGANWPQIGDWVNAILASYLRNLKQMVDMNKILAGVAVSSAKVKTAHNTG
jgi:hypothetical protein